MSHKRVVLIGSQEHDTSLAVIRNQLRGISDVSVSVVDGSCLGENLNISAQFCGQPSRTKILKMDSGQECVAMDEVYSVWNRRWHNPAILERMSEDERTRAFALENWRCLVHGVWLCSSAKWVNPPVSQMVAANKVVQLDVADGIGLRIPETLFSADPTQVKQFVDAHTEGGVVCKSIGNTLGVPSTLTVRLSPEHLEALHALPLSPAIFQEYIVGERDIRIVVIGEQCFGAEIHTSHGTNPVDWRDDFDNPWYPHQLPDSISKKCVELTHLLNLHYGAIDMRLTPDGEYVFFEINPCGQFLFLEVWTGQRIAKALADYLVS
jgi:hypothetical protein